MAVKKFGNPIVYPSLSGTVSRTVAVQIKFRITPRPPGHGGKRPWLGRRGFVSVRSWCAPGSTASCLQSSPPWPWARGRHGWPRAPSCSTLLASQSRFQPNNYVWLGYQCFGKKQNLVYSCPVGRLSNTTLITTISLTGQLENLGSPIVILM